MPPSSPASLAEPPPELEACPPLLELEPAPPLELPVAGVPPELLLPPPPPDPDGWLSLLHAGTSHAAATSTPAQRGTITRLFIMFSSALRAPTRAARPRGLMRAPHQPARRPHPETLKRRLARLDDALRQARNPARHAGTR
ncbi:MAG TPA: hypothetical protein VE987_18220 [Polyangiaceae bacterium]|nr:hypothetical protein [Polyangiaceae bacterium]